MTQTEYMVLYRKGKDLILFDFNAWDDFDDGDELVDLINFHFTDRHDFDERVKKTALSVFKNFYEKSNGGEVEFIDWELKLN